MELSKERLDIESLDFLNEFDHRELDHSPAIGDNAKLL